MREPAKLSLGEVLPVEASGLFLEDREVVHGAWLAMIGGWVNRSDC